MKNPATHEDELNDFTRAVKTVIDGGYHKVRLRNGTYAFPVWDEDTKTFFCHTEDGVLTSWNANGTCSVSDYDMMEIVPIED